MAERKWDGFKVIIVVLLALNTYFIGSMWCAMQCGMTGSKCPFKKICPWTGKGSYGKICPITGKTLMSGSSNAVETTQ